MAGSDPSASGEVTFRRGGELISFPLEEIVEGVSPVAPYPCVGRSGALRCPYGECLKWNSQARRYLDAGEPNAVRNHHSHRADER